ncbi:MAG TPA: hypothetical protein V6D25_27755 [Leptolyngbyaceae cyanobacterium]
MIQEHTPVNQQLVQLATQKGITPPTDVGPKYQAAIAVRLGFKLFLDRS